MKIFNEAIVKYKVDVEGHIPRSPTSIREKEADPKLLKEFRDAKLDVNVMSIYVRKQFW